MLRYGLNKIMPAKLGFIFVSLILFWLMLFLRIPESFSRFFNAFSPGAFVFVLTLYCFAFYFPGKNSALAGLLTLVLLGLTLSYRWTSGFSDNFMIGGLLPYKDARNYYVGANMLLNGLPMVDASQATERPLFPGFLASLLVFTSNNLKISLALIVQTIGFVMFLTARQIRHAYGALSAGLFATLLYFYIQPWVGYSMSETLGFLAGCLGFSLLWRAAQRLSQLDFFLGLAALLIAISARAGAFFIFPFLVVWSGWVLRGRKSYSIRFALCSLLFTVLGYLVVNTIHARLLGIPPGNTFGNFSYALYGQVRGGTGWYSAIRDLGTRNPSIVYEQAFEFFLAHPLSLFIGIAKAYRDFFLFTDAGIFPFGGDWQNWLAVVLWLISLSLLVCGLVFSIKTIRLPSSSLLIAGFIGVFLSIPFLPPVDGGSRFYAGTMPFFLALPSIGLFSIYQNNFVADVGDVDADRVMNRSLVLGLISMVLFLPWMIYRLGKPALHTMPACPSGQEAFLIALSSDSYIDLTKTQTSQCGMVPDVCLSDFERNNIEKSVDDFYQTVLGLVDQEPDGARLSLSLNLITGQAHYFYSAQDALGLDTPRLVSGCAIEINTQYQSIYHIQSLSSESE